MIAADGLISSMSLAQLADLVRQYRSLGVVPGRAHLQAIAERLCSYTHGEVVTDYVGWDGDGEEARTVQEKAEEAAARRLWAATTEVKVGLAALGFQMLLPSKGPASEFIGGFCYDASNYIASAGIAQSFHAQHPKHQQGSTPAAWRSWACSAFDMLSQEAIEQRGYMLDYSAMAQPSFYWSEAPQSRND